MSLHEQMIEWLRTQNPDGKYIWVDSDGCACALFSKSIGQEAEWKAGTLQVRSPWWKLDSFAMSPPHTFGALLARLERRVDFQ